MRRALAGTALLVLLALATLMLVPPLFGYERYVIEGGSMGGAVPRGSIAYEEVVPTSEIEPGDVITYVPPHGEGHVTHRVTSIRSGPHGDRVYRTRGDANPSADPWTFTLPNGRQARVKAHVPLAGYVLEALGVRWIRVAVIGGPALAIALAAFAEAARTRRRELSFG